jgi:predicted alpha/beta superfamily hydrolase
MNGITPAVMAHCRARGARPQARRAMCCIALALATLAAHAAGPAADCKSTVTGDLRLHSLSSQIFKNTRTIRVLLPRGYDEPENATRRYPVLYMLDGQNLFDACLSEVSHHEWEVDETVARLVRERIIPAMIVVGIDYAGNDRAREFLPYRDQYQEQGVAEPEGKRFPDFLTSEVLPLIDQQYRTVPDRAHRGIGGSSYGGVATLYTLLAKPNQFGYGLIESPTLWIGSGQLVRDTAPLTAFPERVFIGFGGKEAREPLMNRRMIRLIRQVEANFAAAGYDKRRFRFVYEPNAMHTEAAWAGRLGGALSFLYGP